MKKSSLRWKIALCLFSLSQSAYAEKARGHLLKVDGVVVGAAENGYIDPRLFELRYKNGNVASVPPECFVKLERNERASKRLADKQENNLTPVPPLAIMPLDCYDVDEKPHTYFNHEAGFYESKIRNEVFGYKVIARNSKKFMVVIKYKQSNEEKTLYVAAVYEKMKFDVASDDFRTSDNSGFYNREEDILLRNYAENSWGLVKDGTEKEALRLAKFFNMQPVIAEGDK